jgi:hypothetical protein
MRLIDADTTIPMIKYATTDNEIGVFPIKIGFDDIVKVLNAQPTVEAIPISFIEEMKAWAEENDFALYASDLNHLLLTWAERKEE